MNNPKNKSCSFFGHRKLFDDEEELKKKLKAIMIDLIENKDVGYFYLGYQGEFDFLCQEVATELKNKYPFLQRIYCCESFAMEDNPRKRAKYIKSEYFDEFVYLPMKYPYFYKRLYFRNCQMIDETDFCVFYIRNTENSGAYKALQHAQKKKKQIINID